MKKLVCLSTTALALVALTGCSSSPESIAQKACKEGVERDLSADKYDYSDLKVFNASEALFELSDKGERDTSKDLFMGSGTVIATTGTIEKKHTVICSITISGGNITDSSITVS